MLSFEKVDPGVLKKLRNEYLDSLSEPQELHVEFIVKQSESYIIKNEKQIIGYIYVYDSKVISEFFLFDSCLFDSENIFAIAIKKLSISQVYCKSFDHVLLKNCFIFFKKYKILGFHFRDIINNQEFIENREINVRLADSKDISSIAEINNDFFETDEELEYFVNDYHTFLYFINKELIGCGIFHRIIENRDDFDIGMLVNPKFKKKGFGTYIIRHLMDYCLKNNWRPICGCDANNIASRRTLEKAGYVANYIFIEFSL